MPTNSSQLAFNAVESFPLKLADVSESLMGGFSPVGGVAVRDDDGHR